MKNITAGPGGRSLFWHLWWAIRRMWAPASLLFLVSLPVQLSFPKLVHGQEQVIFYPELPELSVLGFDDLLYGGHL